MTPEHEKALKEFAKDRIEKNVAKLRLKLGGNIDGFSGVNSQVLFLDKRRRIVPPENVKWFVTIDETGVISTDYKVIYESGEVIEQTTTNNIFPNRISYREGDATIRTTTSSRQVVNEEYNVPGSYTGYFRQTGMLSYAIRNFQFGVRLGILRAEQAIIGGVYSGPFTETVEFIDLPSAETQVYEVTTPVNTRVLISPFSITRL